MKGAPMLGITTIGLNAEGWLRETHRSERERFSDADRAIVQTCVNELRAAAKRPAGQELSNCC